MEFWTLHFPPDRSQIAGPRSHRFMCLSSFGSLAEEMNTGRESCRSVNGVQLC